MPAREDGLDSSLGTKLSASLGASMGVQQGKPQPRNSDWSTTSSVGLHKWSDRIERLYKEDVAKKRKKLQE